MALIFHPKPGLVLVCDYRGFIEPEMVKVRLSVVISPRLRKRDGLCSIVPLSTTAPFEQQEYHCEIEFDRPLPKPWHTPKCWVKADMVYTVSFDRLDLIGVGRDQEGKRKYIQPHVKPEEFQAIMNCVRRGLGMKS